MLSKMEERLVKIMESNSTSADAAQQILADSAVNAHFEGVVRRDNLKRLRDEYSCPVCGAEPNEHDIH